jgi:hypothetical protein
VTHEEALSRIIDSCRRGFMTCQSGPDKRPNVTVDFRSLPDAHAFHDALIDGARVATLKSLPQQKEHWLHGVKRVAVIVGLLVFALHFHYNGLDPRDGLTVLEIAAAAGIFEWRKHARGE